MKIIPFKAKPAVRKPLSAEELDDIDDFEDMLSKPKRTQDEIYDDFHQHLLETLAKEAKPKAKVQARKVSDTAIEVARRLFGPNIIK